MTEPTSMTAAAAAGGVITVAGLATGVPPDLILPSFCGALWALRAVEQGGIVARGLQVVAGTLLAAWCAPALSQMAAALVPAAAGVDPALLRFPVAALVGWGGISILLPRVGRMMGGQQQ